MPGSMDGAGHGILAFQTEVRQDGSGDHPDGALNAGGSGVAGDMSLTRRAKGYANPVSRQPPCKHGKSPRSGELQGPTFRWRNRDRTSRRQGGPQKARAGCRNRIGSGRANPARSCHWGGWPSVQEETPGTTPRSPTPPWSRMPGAAAGPRGRSRALPPVRR